MNTPGQNRTPEEMAAIDELIRKQKQAATDTETKKIMKNGRTVIFIVAGLMLLSGVFFYFQMEDPLPLYLCAPFVAGFIAMGTFYYRNPFVISIIALSVFGLFVLADIVIDPTTVVKGPGIVFKMIIILILARAIKYGRDYKVAMQSKNKDLLDDEFIA